MSELIFGKYAIERRLAVGGMGEVFLASYRSLGLTREFILKSLLPDLASRPDAVKQFLDEARVAMFLNHPNVVTVFETGAWNGTYYIVMEYVPGRNLAELMGDAKSKGVTIPPAVAARLIRDAAAGLDHAHHAVDQRKQPLRLVHRDVSPQNVMVRPDGVVKVVDFGIAKASISESRTATGLVKGKLSYASPEQLAGHATAATDQWALGVMFWELLTHQRLFQGQPTLGPVPLASTRAIGVPTTYDAIVSTMLAMAQEKRFASCGAVAAAIDATKAVATDAEVSRFLEQVPHHATGGPSNFVVSLRTTETPLAATSKLATPRVDARTPARPLARPVGAAPEHGKTPVEGISHTSETTQAMFEALFDRRLKPTGAFASELAAAGYDPKQARPMYLTGVWLKCLEIARRHRYSEQPVGAAYRQLGREFNEGFLHTISGRIVAATMGFLSPMTFLKRFKNYFTLGRRGDTIKFEFLHLDETSALIEVRNPSGVPGEFVAGMIETGLVRMNVDWTIAVDQKTSIHYTLDVTWKPKGKS